MSGANRGEDTTLQCRRGMIYLKVRRRSQRILFIPAKMQASKPPEPRQLGPSAHRKRIPHIIVQRGETHTLSLSDLPRQSAAPIQRRHPTARHLRMPLQWNAGRTDRRQWKAHVGVLEEEQNEGGGLASGGQFYELVDQSPSEGKESITVSVPTRRNLFAQKHFLTLC